MYFLLKYGHWKKKQLLSIRFGEFSYNVTTTKYFHSYRKCPRATLLYSHLVFPSGKQLWFLSQCNRFTGIWILYQCRHMVWTLLFFYSTCFRYSFMLLWMCSFFFLLYHSVVFLYMGFNQICLASPLLMVFVVPNFAAANNTVNT